ncbi:MAG: hypothetical protein GXP15_09840 [Gammaproteobacteria bacterium]|nr:hypothetical protein [Gammaproteobacteria bacterium]
MNIKLADWASVAEIIGAFAIVVSLYLVSSELSDGNRETRAATTQAILDSAMAFNTDILRYADVWEKVLSDEQLSDNVEKRRAIILYNAMMTLNENRYRMSKTGYMEYAEDSLQGMIDLQNYEAWRKSPGAAAHSAEFLEFVDSMRSRGNTE